MKAIILAAGRGSRMGNLTDGRPKCMLQVRGQSLLDRQLSALREAGVTQIGVVTGYKREQVARAGLKEFHNSRWADTSMVVSLACADQWLSADACIVSYSDIFYAATAPQSLMMSTAALAVTYDPNWEGLWRRRFGDPLLDAETFRLTSDGALAQIGSKPDSLVEVEGQYMGLLRFTPEGWQELQLVRSSLPRSVSDGLHMTGTLQKVIEAGRLSISAVQYTGLWGEVDCDDDLLAYQGDPSP